ncbi:MAG: leucine-rich repeat domain-containing protein, partial [Bacteroidales bacterium]|nr:leucine-rich repeat domain-containing protein [Bacteroidales bacterium]
PTGDITIPNTVTHNSNTYTVTSIGEYAFFGCDSITSITIPNSVTSIGKLAFSGCKEATSITVPNSVTSISEGAFRQCRKLTSINIPNSITIIENNTYSECNGLTSITLPNSLITIGQNAFTSCINLTSIIIPNSVTSIGIRAFQNCYRITSLTLPNSLTSIEDLAFDACTGIASITSDALIPPIIESSSFYRVPKTIPVLVPCASIADYQAADYWSDFTNIQCESGLNDILSTETQTKLYPNPTTGNSILEVEGLTKSADVFVYDITGRIVKTYNLQPNQTQLNIDLTSFAKGIYQVKVLNQTKKLIVN